MQRTLRKPLLIVCVFFAMILLQACSINRSVHTEITIPARPDEVWAVLMDAPAYKEWNPVQIEVKGSYAVGQTMELHIRENEEKSYWIDSEIKELVPNEKLNQGGGMPWILTFDHTYLLEPVDGGTKVVQKEDYHGLWLPFWNSDWIEPAYSKANEALRDRVLKLKQGS